MDRLPEGNARVIRPPSSELPSNDPRQVLVRQAARAIGRAGLSTAYGHCSVRLDAASFLVCRAGPMPTVGRGEAGTVVTVEGPLPEGVLGEVRVHQQIYRRRPEVNAVCRVLPPQLMALSAMGLVPQVRHGFAAFFYPAPPLWDDPSLLRDDEAAAGVAQTLGDSPAVVLRGNGAVIAAEDIKRAVTLGCYLEDAARIELAVLAAGREQTAPRLTEGQAKRRATWVGMPAERMWDLLTHEDPERDLARVA
ncbi:class II aldolase/adducin family protein [bacterium BD-1]|nr:class II aldolase/adducin family protein [Ottowia caeni]